MAIYDPTQNLITVDGPELGHRVIEITPRMAADWLKRNPHNRPLQPRVINKYVRDMLDGNWVLDGQAITLASDGTIINGQHRLSAVVQSGVTISSLVVWGV
jgi:hypothetical protein